MGIPDELKKHLSSGEYTLIAEMYKARHDMLGDFKTVTSAYVQMVIDGKREANDGTAAHEILEIATKYLKNKKNTIEELLAANSI
jgi:hypothetical protein